MRDHSHRRRAAALCAAATSLSACGGGESAPDPLCPADLEPTFASIDAHVFSVSCGTDGSSCHSRNGSTESGELNLADDPYAALLGTGSGAPADNLSGAATNLVRVVPGDPDRSFLVIKLRTRRLDDPEYGAGMPFTNPGGLCATAVGTIADWIRSGAKK